MKFLKPRKSHSLNWVILLFLTACMVDEPQLAVCQTSSNRIAKNETTKQRAPVRVFILAGQSNMTGHGVVDLNDPKDYNGGKGTLASVMHSDENKKRMAHLKNRRGEWRVRDDVFVWYQTLPELKTGGLTIGFTGYPNKHHIGPELQFGHRMGEVFAEPVLLVKTAWGGKSLYKDFRPPSAGGSVGPNYTQMLEQIGDAMSRAGEEIPALKDRRLDITGFVWQQGWNDMCDDEATAEYESNLVHFITDIRDQLGKPGLPFVFGQLGNGGEKINDKMRVFRNAQLAVAERKLPNVRFVETAQHARPAAESPNVTHGHHWFGNAESYFLVGDSLGRSMAELLARKPRPRVLILGDSISIGYTNTVREALSDVADVYRPMRNERNPENCAGTDHGINRIDAWLTIAGGNWDVIHANFGLHDLKRVNPETGQNSKQPTDPMQSNPDEYEIQLSEILRALKATGAKVIVATTTPVPPGCVAPWRDPKDPDLFNARMKRVAAKIGGGKILVNDLFSFAEPQLSEIQRKANVHFTPQGSKVLGKEVARVIREQLPSLNKDGPESDHSKSRK